MQGNSAPGLDTHELLQLLSDLSRDAQEIAERCLATAELLIEIEQLEQLEQPRGTGLVPDTFPADWA
jgi:hypothetical protein